jgi:NitT/TauT family transport system substrate-binding protein
MTRRHTLGVLGAATAAAVPRLAPAQTQPVHLRLASAPDDDATPILYALSAGLFRAAGLDVELTAAGSGSAVAAAVAGGGVDIGKSNMIVLITAHARGVPLTLVAPSGLYLSALANNTFLVLKDSPIRAGHDFNGKIVAVPALNDLQSLAARAWIDQNGGDVASVRFVEVPANAVAAAVDSGRIDAGAVANPAMAQALGTGKYRGVGSIADAIAKRYLTSAWFGNGDFVHKNADAIRRFAGVVRDASIYANAHHPQTVDLLARFSGADSATIAKMTRSEVGTSLDPADIQPLIDVAAKYGVVAKRFDAREMTGG